jgi:hypothetical protein
MTDTDITNRYIKRHKNRVNYYFHQLFLKKNTHKSKKKSNIQGGGIFKVVKVAFVRENMEACTTGGGLDFSFMRLESPSFSCNFVP